MSKNEIILERTSVPLINVMEADADGYVWINAGAYNAYNESGQYYDGDGIEALFEPTSALARRISKGVVRSELGHPRQLPGMSSTMYEARMMDIQEDRYCGHIRAAKIVNNKDGKMKITKINITPFGHYKSTLADALATKDSNCFFSVRSMSNRRVVNGVLVKKVYQIITWDFVTEGGLNKANKFDTDVDLESMDSKQLMENIKTNEMMNIDLNNTSEVKYVLKHFEEYRRSNLDKESNETVSVITNLLGEAVTSKDSDIFKWK